MAKVWFFLNRKYFSPIQQNLPVKRIINGESLVFPEQEIFSVLYNKICMKRILNGESFIFLEQEIFSARYNHNVSDSICVDPMGFG